jgi:hypothetical protein
MNQTKLTDSDPLCGSLEQPESGQAGVVVYREWIPDS